MNISENSFPAPWLARLVPLAITLLILWMATGLRFYQIDSQSFWNDEGNSARLSERSLELIIEGTASDIHPPLYYVLLRGWRELLGEHEFGLRSFSAFSGILTVAALLALARQLLVKNRGEKWMIALVFLATFLAAINPALVYYSRETRMYALLALLSALSTLVLWRWMTVDRHLSLAIAYIVLVTAGLYTHYFFPAIIILHSIIVLIWVLNYLRMVVFSPIQLNSDFSVWKTLLQYAGMLLLMFLLYLPWLPIFIRQTGGRPGVRESFPVFLWDSGRWLAFGETVADGDLVWAAAAVFLLAGWAVFAGRWRSLIPLSGIIVPLAMLYISGATQPAFFKFLLSAVPFFCLLLGGVWMGPQMTNQRKMWFIIPTLLLLLMFGGTVVSLNNLYNDPTFFRADYRGMAARIAAENHPNAGIILNAPNQWEVFTYYHQEGAPVYPLPKGQPDPGILEPQLAEIGQKHDRIYAIFWGEDQRDPQRVVEGWLDRNSFKASEEWISDVRFVVYAVPETAAQEMEHSAEVIFGDAIVLNGYTLRDERLQAGDIAQVTLFWQAVGDIENRYKVFLHLVDQSGNLIAQRDGEPGGGTAITTEWQPGEVAIDNHGLLIPINIPPGEYQLIMGLYDISDPADRLSVTLRGSEQDYWQLGTLVIE